MRYASFLVVLALAACGKSFDADQYPSPESLYDAAMASYRSGDCTAARRAFQRLQFELPPRDPRQAEARYYYAECLLDQGEQLEAARQFRRVSDEFPRHPLAPDALLRAGDAYADLWNDPELDPTYGETALATWRELLGRYPGSTAAQRARLRMADVREMFAQKEYQTGRFYLRLRAFDSAIIYFKEVVANYPESAYASRAVLRLIEAYDRIGYVEERDEMCGYLRRYYPDAVTAASQCRG